MCILSKENYVEVFKMINYKLQDEDSNCFCGFFSEGLFVTVLKAIPELKGNTLTLELYTDSLENENVGQFIIDFNKAKSYKVEFNEKEGAFEFLPLIPMSLINIKDH